MLVPAVNMDGPYLPGHEQRSPTKAELLNQVFNLHCGSVNVDSLAWIDANAAVSVGSSSVSVQ